MKKLLVCFACLFTPLAWAADPLPQYCISAETRDGYTMITNKCDKTVNATWFYDGECAAGCSRKLAPKAYLYVSLFKPEYKMGVCYSPAKVDPKWTGNGEAPCK